MANWWIHGLSCALVLIWVITVCGMSFWEYALLFVYPGLALTRCVRFLNIQAVPEPAHRSVIVESRPLLSLLFLNNNLHAVHHESPGLPWYRIPAVWRAQRDAVLTRNRHYYFPGYGAIMRRYAWRAKEQPCYPL
ncbi:MAG: fatty acid desaturase [Thiolinea sp.]